MNFPKQGIACVGAVCVAEKDGQKHVLLQERWKPTRDPIYSGTLETPVGVLDLEFEPLHEAVMREIREEAGLRTIKVHGVCMIETNTRGDEYALIEPFCVTQVTKGGKPWVMTGFVCDVEYTEPTTHPEETRNPRWVPVSELQEMIKNPDLFFPLTYPMLKKFIEQ